jgi:hypothetical protein
MNHVLQKESWQTIDGQLVIIKTKCKYKSTHTETMTFLELKLKHLRREEGRKREVTFEW